MTDRDAADFYLGRGPDARYLGTLNSDGAPEDIEAFVHFQSLDMEALTEGDYAEHVRVIIDSPQWVREQHDSLSTPWTYMYDRGSVYVYRFGTEMAKIVCNFSRENREHTAREPRPAMSHQFPLITKEAS